MLKVWPEHYGAIPDGKTPARWALQSCLDALAAAGGGDLDLSRGLYAITDAGLVIPSDVPIAIRGGGPNTGLAVLPGFPSGGNALFSQGGGIVYASTVAADALAGALAVEAAEPARFAIGDTLRIGAAATSGVGTTIWGFQHNTVVDMVGDSLILARPLAFSLQAGAYLQKTQLRRGLVLADFAVYSRETGVDHNAIVLSWERGALVENILTEGTGDTAITNGAGAGLVLSDGYENGVRNVRVFRGGSNGEDAIAFRQQTGLSADSVHSVAGVFGIGITATDSQFSNLSSMRDYGRGIKLHSTYGCRFSNLLIGGSRHVGLGLTAGSRYNAFSGVTVRGVNTVGGQNIGVWFNSESNNYNVVMDLVTQNVPYPVAQSPTDIGNVVKQSLTL